MPITFLDEEEEKTTAQPTTGGRRITFLDEEKTPVQEAVKPEPEVLTTQGGRKITFLDKEPVAPVSEAPQPPVGTSFMEEVRQIPQALQQAVEQPLEAMGETAEVLGAPRVSAALRGATEAPEGYVPAAQRFMEPQEGEFQIGGFAPQFLPRAIVEQGAQVVGSIASSAAGRIVGGLVGSVAGPVGRVTGATVGQFLGPALFEMSQIVGPAARERAKNQGREEPTTDDLAWAWATAGASGALNAIGARYLPNGDKLAGPLSKRIATTIAGEGSTEGLQNIVQQTGQTFLTESGFNIEPKEAIGETIIGGGAGGAATLIAAPFTPTPEKKAEVAAETVVAAQSSTDIAPATADVVSEQAATIIEEAKVEITETPDQRVARLQEEATAAAGIELEEEGVGVEPTVPVTPPATPTPEGAVAPVEPPEIVEKEEPPTPIPTPTEAVPVEKPTVAGFTTAQGSTYEVTPEGKTIRTKRSEGRGQGETYEPHSVLFVPEQTKLDIQSDMASGMGENSLRMGYTQDNRFVQVTDTAQIPEGITPQIAIVNRKSGQIVPNGVYDAQRNPEVGLGPIEKLYSPDGTSSTHIGNQITEVRPVEPVVTPVVAEPQPVAEVAVEPIPEVIATPEGERARAFYHSGPRPLTVDTASFDKGAMGFHMGAKTQAEWVAKDKRKAEISSFYVRDASADQELETESIERDMSWEQADALLVELVSEGILDKQEAIDLANNWGDMSADHKQALSNDLQKVKFGDEYVGMDGNVGEFMLQSSTYKNEDKLGQIRQLLVDKGIGAIEYVNEVEGVGGNPQAVAIFDKRMLAEAPAAVTPPAEASPAPEVRESRREQPVVLKNRFYSQLERTVAAKMPNVSSPEQLKAIIDPTRGSGVKPEEIKWSGITEAIDRIAAENNGRVPKEAIIKYMQDEGAVKFEEVTLARKKVPYTGGEIKKSKDGKYYILSFLGYDNVYTKLEDAKADLQKMREGMSRTDDATEYSKYQLPNGENYREVVLTIPSESAEELSQKVRDLSRERRGIQESDGMLTREESNRITEIDEETRVLEDRIERAKLKYKSPHFANISNYVAHIRLNDRKDADRKDGTFIEEIQSDLHQKAREVGYKDENIVQQNFASWLNANKKELSEQEIQTQFKTHVGEEIQQWLKDQEVASKNASAVPDAPFRKDWPIQMFKRALEQAVMSGKDWIGWTTGETQASRYDLSKRISKVGFEPNKKGDFSIGELYAYDLDNKLAIRERNIKPEQLADYIGKEAAEKLLQKIEEFKASPQRTGMRPPEISGLDLKVGGEGMAGFYDNILPKEIAKYVKKWGATVEKSFIGKSPSKEFTDAVERFEEAKRLYGAESQQATDAMMAIPSESGGEGVYEIWRVNITPEMRRIIEEEGQSLFSLQMPSRGAGMETEAVATKLESLGFGRGGIVSVVNEPDASFEGRTIIRDGKVVGIELNAAALKDDAAVERVLNHEIAESANADGALNTLVAGLTPKERKEINDAITRLGYAEKARTAEEAARAVELLAEGWRGRRWFERAVARVEAWANKLGYKLTRRAAEYIAARNVSEINAEFKQAYNKFVDKKTGDEARYSYAGVTANTPQFMRDSLSVAQAMAAKGEDAETIRSVTGWIVNPYDGKLRWEIPDNDASFTENASKVIPYLTIGDAISHPELFEAYPDAKNILFKKQELSENEGGYFDPISNLIVVNSKKTNDEQISSALHEIQHWIQKRENFAKGASPSEFLYDTSFKLSEESKNKIDKIDLERIKLREEEVKLSEFFRSLPDSKKGVGKNIKESRRLEEISYRRRELNDAESKIISPERNRFAMSMYQRTAGEIEARDVSSRRKLTPEQRKASAPYTSENISPDDAVIMGSEGGIASEIRESRREDAIPTFSEGSPEASTLSTMAASMAKVDAASEGKPNPENKPTYKISEIASVWMDQGGDERQLQDMVVEYTNLTPANAKKVANAIAKQYGLQQQIAETGAVIAEPAPEAEGAPRKTSVQRLIEQAVGVRRPIVKLEVNEKTALKEQIRLKAREARETRKARKEAARELAEAVTQYVKDNQIRGPVRARQTISLAKQALKLDVNNEKAVDRYIMYVERVVENANYDKDLSDARALRKRAKQMAKNKNIGPEQKKVLEAIGNINPSLLDNPYEYNVLTERYLLGFIPVTSARYSVMPDAEARQYLESLEEQMKNNQSELDRAELERFFESRAGFAQQRGLTMEEAESLLNEDGDISTILNDFNLEKKEATEEMLLNLAQNAQKTLKTYDDTANTARQKELISFMQKVKLESITSDEKKRFIRFANNVLANGETFGVEQFEAIAKAQMASIEAAKDKRLSKKFAAWISPIAGETATEAAKGLAQYTQSEADTLKNIFGREAVGAFRKLLGLLELDRKQTLATKVKEQIANKVGQFYENLKKKYGEDAVNMEAKTYAAAAGYFIQAEGNKTQEESIAYRRRLWQENIEDLRQSERKSDRDEAELKQKALEALTGNSNAEILNSLKSLNPASYEQLMWWKDEMHPEHKEFLKEHNENFRNQADNYSENDYLSIHYKWKEYVETPSELDAQEYEDPISFRIRQSANSIKRKEHANLPVNPKTNTKANIDVNFGYNQYSALTDQIDRAYTAPAWESVWAFTRVPEFETIVGGRANANFVKNILRNIKATRSKRAMLDDENQIIGGNVALARRLATQATLGGATQPIRQVPDQLFKLFSTSGRWDIIASNIANSVINYSGVVTNNPLLDKFPISRRGDARAGSQFAAEFNELARKVEASATNKKWAKYKELMNKMGEFWMTPLRASDAWIAKVSWLSYYEAYLNRNNVKMESFEREAELAETDQVRQEAAAQAEYMVDFYAGASDPTKMAALSKQSNNGWREFAKLVFLPLNSFALQQKSALISDARDLMLREGDRKAALAGIVGNVAGMVAFHGIRIYLIGGLIYPAGMAVLKGIFGIDMDEPDEEEQDKQVRDNWRKMKASIYANIVAGGAGQFFEGLSIDAFNKTMYLWDAQINPDEILNKDGEVMSFGQYEKEMSPFYRYRSYASPEYTFGLVDVLTEQAQRSVAQTGQLLSDEEMSAYTQNEQAYAYFSTTVEWLYFFKMMDTDATRVARRLKQDMDRQVKEREAELRAIRNR